MNVRGIRWYEKSSRDNIKLFTSQIIYQNTEKKVTEKKKRHENILEMFKNDVTSNSKRIFLINYLLEQYKRKITLTKKTRL
jgi:hypothetical protein